MEESRGKPKVNERYHGENSYFHVLPDAVLVMNFVGMQTF
jgi:hypothetical protein